MTCKHERTEELRGQELREMVGDPDDWETWFRCLDCPHIFSVSLEPPEDREYY